MFFHNSFNFQSEELSNLKKMENLGGVKIKQEIIDIDDDDDDGGPCCSKSLLAHDNLIKNIKQEIIDIDEEEENINEETNSTSKRLLDEDTNNPADTSDKRLKLMSTTTAAATPETTNKITEEDMKKIDDQMTLWFNEAMNKNLPITGPLFQQNAHEVAEKLNLGSKFKADTDWLEEFCSSRDIFSCQKRVKVPVTDEWKKVFTAMVKDYTPDNIYAFLELGLVFKKPIGGNNNGANLLSIEQQLSDCAGSMFTKERLTICLCCNANGDREIPLVISKSLRQKFCNGVAIPTPGVKWRANKKIFLTKEMFDEWLNEFNDTLKEQNRKIIMFVNKTPCHPIHFYYSNIELKSFPIASISCLQPLKQTIVQRFRIGFVTKVFEKLLVWKNVSSAVSYIIASEITVIDALKLIGLAWNDVNAKHITTCFKQCYLCSGGAEDSGIEFNEVQLGESIRQYIDELKAIKDFDQAKSELIKLATRVEMDLACFLIDIPTYQKYQSDGVVKEERLSSDEEEDEDELALVKTEPLTLQESLTLVARLRETFSKLDTSEESRMQAIDYLDDIENALEDIIVEEKLRN